MLSCSQFCSQNVIQVKADKLKMLLICFLKGGCVLTPAALSPTRRLKVSFHFHNFPFFIILWRFWSIFMTSVKHFQTFLCFERCLISFWHFSTLLKGKKNTSFQKGNFQISPNADSQVHNMLTLLVWGFTSQDLTQILTDLKQLLCQYPVNSAKEVRGSPMTTTAPLKVWHL